MMRLVLHPATDVLSKASPACLTPPPPCPRTQWPICGKDEQLRTCACAGRGPALKASATSQFLRIFFLPFAFLLRTLRFASSRRHFSHNSGFDGIGASKASCLSSRALWSTYVR